MQSLMLTCQDVEGEVRSNAAFATGILCQAVGPALHKHYPAIMQTLYTHCLQPTSNDMFRASDNAVGAVARMFLTAPQLIHLDAVLPALMNALPLRCDFEESVPVFAMFDLLMSAPPSTHPLPCTPPSTVSLYRFPVL